MKTIIITGCSELLGYELSKICLEKGCQVIGHSRKKHELNIAKLWEGNRIGVDINKNLANENKTMLRSHHFGSSTSCDECFDIDVTPNHLNESAQKLYELLYQRYMGIIVNKEAK